VDLVDFGAALLDWQDQQVAQTIKDVAASDLLVVASPTYKATYTGLLKLFLDRIAGGGLAGVTAVPLMLGGDWRHSLAADMLLKPVLVELGATCPTRGLFLTDSDYAQSPVLDAWLEASRPQLTALLG
jgi:FMN reductase